MHPTEYIALLQKELTKAREAYERINAICQNPFSTNDDWRDRYIAWGRWNGIAKAVEVLQDHA